jgi:hypothetical protein
MGMGKTNTRLDAARKAYRDALEAARANPTPEAWAKLLAAGKDLSAETEPKARPGRRSRRNAVPTFHELEEGPRQEAHEMETME